MDVIACHQAGFKNVVATSGTAITEEQLKILSRYAGEVAFAFDTDVAGEAAMKKAIQLSLKNDISTRVIALPAPFKDPDEAIKNSPKNWTKAIEVAKPSLEYWIDLLVRKHPDLEVLTKKKIAKEILPVIKAVFSDIEKEYYIKYLAKKLSVAEKTLIAALEKSKVSDEAKHGEETGDVEMEKAGTSERILGFLWHEPKFIDLVEKEVDKLSDSNLPNFVQMIKNKKIDKEKLPPSEINILNQLDLSEAENIDFSNEELARNELNFLLGRLRSDSREKLKSDFAQKIQAAEERGDKSELKRLMAEFSSLIK
jgi:DNA primase